MKKIIITTLALVCGLGAYAKTLAELKAELPAYSDNKEVRAARLAYIKENAADFLREFNAWAGTNAAKFYGSEEPNSQMTEAQKAEAVEMRKFFYAVYWVLEPDCPANTGLRLAPQLYIKNAESVNPTYYRDLKAAGFEIDGVKLPSLAQIRVAAICGDLDFFANLDWDSADNGGLFAAAADAKRMLVRATDPDKAAGVCAEYKRALVLRGAASDSPTLAEIKTAEMFLNEAILNKQIRSK